MKRPQYFDKHFGICQKLVEMEKTRNILLQLYGLVSARYTFKMLKSDLIEF